MSRFFTLPRGPSSLAIALDLPKHFLPASSALTTLCLRTLVPGLPRPTSVYWVLSGVFRDCSRACPKHKKVVCLFSLRFQDSCHDFLGTYKKIFH